MKRFLPSLARRTLGALLALPLAAPLTGCDEEPNPPQDTPLAVGDSREITLRFTPLDVTNFEKTLARLELRQLPPGLIERTWLTDIDLRGAENGAPQLIDHALQAILSLDPSDPSLEPAKANLVALLKMSPQTADLSGTSMQALLELAPNIGFSVPEVLGAALGVAPDQAFLSPADVGAAMVEFVIGSHPNARVRPGPQTADNPDGLYPVRPGKLPVFLDDVLSDLRTLQRRYGPYAGPDGYHPGFIAGPVEATLFEEDLVMVVKANTNGAPDKGVDLETASIAGVNSIDDAPETLFDFDDPDWLNIEGSFVDPPRIGRMLFALGEDPRFIAGGTNRQPAPRGDGAVWTAAPYTLERVVAEAAFARWRDHTVYEEFRRRDTGEPLLTLDVDQGWLSLATPGRVGEPPPPTYIWDLITEVAQIRVHDGDIAEGEANVSFVLEDVALGLSMADLIGGVKRSLQADPAGLVQVAATLFDNTWGEADFFYRRPRGEDTDYLFFIHASDIPKERDGTAIRPYDYAKPGFWAEPALTTQLGTTDTVDGDRVHIKLQVSAGDTFYVQDEADQVYRVTVGQKPSRATLPLTIERVR